MAGAIRQRVRVRTWLYVLRDVPVEAHPYYWGGGLQVFGRYGVWNQSNSLEVLDTTDPAQPSLSRHELPGWYCSSIELHEGHAYCVAGRHGVFDIEL